MDSLIFTAVFAVLLCASGVDGQTGQACNTGSTCTATTDVCENNICKRKVDQTCANPNQNQCVLGAQCDSTTTCKCKTPAYVAVTTGTDAGKCGSSPTYVGGTCSGTGTDKGTCLDTNALCTNSVCVCKTNYVRNQDNTCVADGQTGATGQACNTGSTCTATTDVCDSNICKRKVDQTCASPNQNQCVLGAQCDSTTTCKCRTPAYVAVTSGTDAGKCGSSPTYVGGSCTGTGTVTDKSTCLDTNALCTNNVCVCKTNYIRNQDTNTCSACSMMTLSVTLMLLGLIVTSRFL